MTSKHAFSLVELSIVLVILGLLVGGIFAGQSLIRAAELRSISNEITQYRTATYSFRDKYFALPGDMANATAFWGDDAANCTDPAVADGNPGTCNGNGNGLLTQGAVTGGTNEWNQYWKHLALAGLIGGNYTGLAGPTNAWESLPGINSPRTKINGGGYNVFWWKNYTGTNASPTIYDGNYGNMLVVGMKASSTLLQGDPLFTPHEAWNIDTKLDDANPATGFIVMRPPAESTAANCATGTNSSGASATYNLTYSSAACAVHAKLGI